LIKLQVRTATLRPLALAISALLLGFTCASAQSTVFNIPSTDVQPRGKVYLEANFIIHFGSLREGGYQEYGPRVVVGLPGNMEVGINAFHTRAEPAEPIEIQPNFKWQFYANEKKGLAFATGVLISTPVTRHSSGTTSAQLYVVGSKSFEGSYGPRVTFGGYRLVGSLDDDIDKNGVMLGLEQPLTKRISFVTDWSSGKNDYGYLVVGTGITLSPNGLLYTGYNFGNQGRGNNYLGIFYGYTF
jgi:hypothetical protein